MPQNSKRDRKTPKKDRKNSKSDRKNKKTERNIPTVNRNIQREERNIPNVRNQHFEEASVKQYLFYFFFCAFSCQLLFLDSETSYCRCILIIVGLTNIVTEVYHLDSQLRPFYKLFYWRVRTFCVLCPVARMYYAYWIHPLIADEDGNVSLDFWDYIF